MNASDTYVTLQGGLVLSADALICALSLEARGVRLSLASDGALLARGALTDADRAAIRRWRDELRAIVTYVTTEGWKVQ